MVKKKLQQIPYMLKLIWQYQPSVYFILVGQMITRVLLPFALAIFPAVLVEILSSQLAFKPFLYWLVVFVLALFLLQAFDAFLNSQMSVHKASFRMHYLRQVSAHYYDIDYPLIISKEGLDKYWNALILTSNDSEVFGHLLTDIINLVSAVLAICLYITLFLQIDWQLLWIVLAIVLVLVVFKVVINRWQEANKDKLDRNNSQFNYIIRLLSNTKLAKDYRLYQMHDWINQVKKNLDSQYHFIKQPFIRLQTSQILIVQLLVLLLTYFAYQQSVSQVVTGTLAVGQLMVVVSSITLLVDNLNQFIEQIAIFDRHLFGLQRFRTFIEQPTVFHHGQGATIDLEAIEIECDNVSYTYPNNDYPTIENLSIRFRPHEKIAVVGENGAGKSTFVKLLMGLLKPDSGEIRINGIKQEAFNIHDYYGMFSVVFQDITLLTYTIKETILQGFDYEADKYQKVLKESGMDEIIATLPDGDNTPIVSAVDSHAVTLSGGQMQKLKLAQALYKDGPILILDEPTAALDPLAEANVYQSYLKFADNRLSFFISHRLSSTQFCDRIIYLKNGKISEEGSHEALLALNGDYAHLYHTQAYYYQEELSDNQLADLLGGEQG